VLQAPGFYRRHGFAVVEEVTGYPARHAYLPMCRHLAKDTRGAARYPTVPGDGGDHSVETSYLWRAARALRQTPVRS